MSAAAAIRPRDDLEQMTVGIFEIDTAAGIVVVDPEALMLTGIGPILELPLAQAAENLVEFVLAHQKRVMLGRDLAVRVVKIERDTVARRDDEKRSEGRRRRQAEDVGQEFCRLALVAAPDDRVVELDGHAIAQTLPETARVGACGRNDLNAN